MTIFGYDGTGPKSGSRALPLMSVTSDVSAQVAKRQRQSEILGDTVRGLAWSVPGSLVGAVDTVGQSVGLFDEDTVASSLMAMDRSIGTGGFAETYEGNRSGYRLVGDIGTMFVGAGAATKVVRGAGWLKNATFLAGAGPRLKTTLNIADKLVFSDTSRVTRMTEHFANRALVYGEKGLREFAVTSEGRAMARRIRLQQLANDVREGVAGEIVIGLTMNESDLLFPEGLRGQDLAINGLLGVALPAGIGQLAVRPGLARAAGEAGKAATEASRPYVGSPGFDLVSSVYAKESIRDKRLNGAFDGLGVDNPEVGNQIAAIENTATFKFNEATENLAKATPLAGFSRPVPADEGLRRTAETVAKFDPRSTTALISIERASAIDDLAEWKTKRELEIIGEMRAAEDGRKLAKPGSSEEQSYITKLRRLKEEEVFLRDRLIAWRANRLGIMSTNVADKSVFDQAGVRTYQSMTAGKRAAKRESIVVTHADDGLDNIGITISGRVLAEKAGVVKGVRYKGVRNVENLTHYQRSKVVQAIPAAVRALGKWVSGEATAAEAVFTTNGVSKTASVEELTYALTAADEFGFDNARMRQALDLGEFDSREDLMLALIDAKYKRYKQMIADVPKDSIEAMEVDYDFASRLLVPTATDLDRKSFLVEWFDNLRAGGYDSVGDSLDRAQADFLGTISVGSTAKTVEEIMAKQDVLFERSVGLNLMELLDGSTSRTPATMIGRQLNPGGTSWQVHWNEVGEVAKLAADERELRLAQDMLNPQMEHMQTLAKAFDELEAEGEVITAIREAIGEVVASQGSIPLFERAGHLIPQTLDWLQRHAPGTQAASALQDAWSRWARQVGENELKNNTEAVQMLFDSANQASKIKYLSYQSEMFRGWDIEPGALFDLDNGMVRLADSPRNRKIAEQLKLDEVPEHLPDMVLDASGQYPLVLDGLSQRALVEMNRFSDINYHTVSSLRYVNDRAPLTYRQGHMPAPSRYDRNMVFIQHADGRVIDFELGRTEAEAIKRAQSRANARDDSAMLSVISKEQVEQWHLANNRAWNEDALDMTKAWNQTGEKAAEGGRTGVILSDNFIRGQLDAVMDMYQEHAKLYTMTKFRAELNQLDALSRMSALDQGGFKFANDASARPRAWSNVYQSFASQLLGRQVDNPGSVFSVLNGVTDGLMDAALDKVYGMLFSARKAGAGVSGTTMKGFKEIAEEAGYDPVGLANQAYAREFGVDSPPMARELSRKVAQATTFVALRLFEPGHMLLTTASIATTAPHVAAFMRRKPGESADVFRRRVGVIAAAALGDNAEAAVPSGTKLMMSTMQKFFRGEYADVLKEAEERGFLTAHVAEFMDELAGKYGKTATQKAVDGTLKFLAKPTDWSENFARKFTFLMGYELFSTVGAKGRNISLAAANDFANKAIADYRPHQRSELFRGAAGVQLGLFQTFGLNYLSRMATSIENKQGRALWTQVATQQFMFGANSLPGWDAVNEGFLATWDHQRRPEDNFHEMEATGLADIMLYGTLSNLPRLLGADPIAAYTRGDIQLPRTHSVLDWKETPAAVMASRSYESLSNGFKAAAQMGTLGEARFLESMVLAMPNRPLKGVMELGQGYASNKYGDIVSGDSDEFYSLGGFVSRVMGMKPLAEAKRTNAMWRDTQRKIAQRNKIDTLRNSVVAQLRRRGSISGDQLAEVVEQYVAYGLEPSNLRAWLKRAAMKAEVSRYDRELIKKLRSSERGRELLNFVNSVDGVNEAAAYGLGVMEE